MKKEQIKTLKFKLARFRDAKEESEQVQIRLADDLISYLSGVLDGIKERP